MTKVLRTTHQGSRWVAVNITVPFGVPSRIRHLIFMVSRRTERDRDFDNYPDGAVISGALVPKIWGFRV